jgi:hypothetical protein
LRAGISLFILNGLTPSRTQNAVIGRKRRSSKKFGHHIVFACIAAIFSGNDFYL